MISFEKVSQGMNGRSSEALGADEQRMFEHLHAWPACICCKCSCQHIRTTTEYVLHAIRNGDRVGKRGM